MTVRLALVSVMEGPHASSSLRSMVSDCQIVNRRRTVNRFDHQVAIVTGAASGVGATTARCRLRGAAVAIADIDDEMGESRRRRGDRPIRGGQALAVHLDVASEIDWTAAVEWITAQLRCREPPAQQRGPDLRRRDG